MAEGFSLSIDDNLLKKLDEADKKITKLADTSEKASKRIVKSFQDIGTQGMDSFIKKISELNTAIGSLSKGKTNISNALGVSKSIDDVNKLISSVNKLNQETQKNAKKSKGGGVFGDMSKSITDWQNLQRQIVENEKQIARLSQSTREYEATLKRIQSGKGGVIAAGATKEYQENIKNIETLRQQNASLQQKQQLIIQNNQAMQAQANLQQQLKQYHQQQGSLPEQRKNDELKRMNDYYRELEKSSKKAADESVKAIERETKSRERAQRAAQKQEEAEAKRQQRASQSNDAKIMNAYNQAMKANEATINQRINKIAKLRQVESQLSSDEQKYATQLSKVRSEMDRLSQANKKAEESAKNLRRSKKNLMDTAGQLQRKLALLFSVSAVQGYINKLVSVRGEFEMQQRSLQVLLQDRDKANELWDKTVALAVKSPFRVKELVTYTKQLAAYRIESDKLYETNKMLADVSAGLGVDMNRLILAFGQVKAANYLRGTELRQFSEAGVNMLGELAKYFTEVEGRAVSVGDVFERVSKRMVSFENVETVFKRITGESGVFYQMQEKQSETLRGMMMNFHDSMDLMLNEIGKDQDSVLKNAVKLSKAFVDNWRIAEPIIKTICYTFLATFSAKQLSRIGAGLATISTAISKHPFVAILGLVTAIVVGVYQWAHAQSKLNAALSDTENEGLKTMRESISLYHELTEVINDATKSNEERNKALSTLQTKLEDILPNQYLEIEYIKQLKNNYKDAEDAMFAYYNAKVRAQKEDKIRTHYAESISTDTSDLISAISNQINEYKNWGDKTKQILLSGVSGAVNGAIEDIESGKIKPEELLSSIKKRMDKYAKTWFDTSKENTFSQAFGGLVALDNWGLMDKNIRELTKSLIARDKELKNIQGMSTETYDELLVGDEINREAKNVEKAVDLFNKAVNKYEQYINVIPTAEKNVLKQREEIEQDVQNLLKDLPKEFEAYIPYLKDVFSKLKAEADKSAFDFKASIQKIKQSLYLLKDDKGNVIGGLSQIAKNNINFAEEWRDAGEDAIDNFEEGIKREAAKLDMNPMQKAVIKGARGIANKFGVDLNLFEKFIPQSEEALQTVSQNLDSYIKNWEERIEKFDSSSAVEDFGVWAPDILTEKIGEIEKMRDALPALREFAKLLGILFKDSSKNRSNKLMEERIKVIDQMNKKYKELNKTLSHSESLEGAFEAYVDAFADAYGRSDVKSMSAEEFASKVLRFPDEDEVVKWLDNLAQRANNVDDKIKAELKKGEYVYDIKVRTKEENDKELLEQIEDMFSGYELSLELQKLNIPPDLAKQLFDIESLTLPELKDKVVSMESQFIGTDMEEEYRKFLKKIDEMEENAQMERLKKYSQYLVKAQSERVKIKLEELRQIREIEEEEKFTDDQKDSIKQKIRIETQTLLDKQEWNDFKNSDMYTQLFSDLETIGVKSIERLKTTLNGLKSSLSELDPASVKEIMSSLEKLEEIEIKSNPFKAMRDALKDVNDLQEKGRTEDELNLILQESEALKNKAKGEIDAIDIILKAREQNHNVVFEELNLEEKYSDLMGKTNDQLNDRKKIQEGIVRKSNTTISDAVGDLAKYQKARKALQAMSNQWNTLKQVASSAFNDIETILTSMGVDAESTEMQILSIAGGLTDSIVQAVLFGLQLKLLAVEAEALGVAINSALGPIGWIAIGLSTVANLFSSIFGNVDKKREKQIEREQELVATLEHQYKKLEKAIDAAYSISSIKSSTDAAERNLKQQISSYERMIEAEEGKKDVDQKKINGWRRDIDDLYTQLRELEQQRIEMLGGFGSDQAYKEASQAFVDAWMDAYRETGDGLDALDEQFDEFFVNMVKKQLLGRGVRNLLQPFYNQFDEMFSDSSEGGAEATKRELRDIQREWENLSPQLNDMLKNLVDSLGLAGELTSTTGELSGLQRGIRGVTEETAQIIEAYMASVRFYVADSNSKLTIIANQIVGSDETTNPMLSELRSQTELIRSIRDMFGSVIKQGHSTFGGAFLKVSL